jgi:dTDP-glucose 4,6-dehydratase
MRNHRDGQPKTYLVTGGAGFIGSALCRYLVKEVGAQVVCLDKLTYAASLDSLSAIRDHAGFTFCEGDIADRQRVGEILEKYQPTGIINLAAETHVDRSIDGPAAFVATNIVGTFNLLETALSYWRLLPNERQESFRFLHVSTDEVYGSLTDNDPPFLETTAYAPRSPYSASKAASDHLVNAWHHTYGLPILITNCSNNYGPYQFPEKLIPLAIVRAVQGLPIPVYGAGMQIRDWLFVDDHVRAIHRVLTGAKPGTTFNIGGGSERRNIEVVQTLCDILDEFEIHRETSGGKPIGRARDLIEFVTDRPGHDFRYAIDSRQLKDQLGWQAQETFESGIRKTVAWYLDHASWWRPILSDRYKTDRLGLQVRA